MKSSAFHEIAIAITSFKASIFTTSMGYKGICAFHRNAIVVTSAESSMSLLYFTLFHKNKTSKC